MTTKKVWKFVRSSKIVLNDDYSDPEYPPDQYPILIKGFLDHDPDREIVMPIGVPENEQIARRLQKLGEEWVARKAGEDEVPGVDVPAGGRVLQFRNQSLDDGAPE
jgi:hypothetical protein